MRIPSNPDDELLKSLVEETTALPRTAAAQARAYRRTQRHTVCIAAVMATWLSVAGIWFSKRDAAPGKIARTASPSEALKPSAQGSVKAYPAGEVAGINSIPPDASESEKKLLTELAGIPLLIVKNDAGEVARVHIFER